MKKVTRCLGCDTVVRIHGSYKVRLTERIKMVLTGEMKEAEVEGRICRDCAVKAGYSPRGRKEK